jgi:hypothetical protein
MPRYKVTYRGHGGQLYSLTVHANNEHDARDKAKRELSGTMARVASNAKVTETNQLPGLRQETD